MGEPNLRSVAVSGLFDPFSVGEFGDEVSFHWVARNQFDSNELRRKNYVEIIFQEDFRTFDARIINQVGLN
jgi:hypothetical protein